MEPYIELRPVMTIKTEALVAPLECSVPTIQDIQRIKSFFFTYHKLKSGQSSQALNAATPEHLGGLEKRARLKELERREEERQSVYQSPSYDGHTVTVTWADEKRATTMATAPPITTEATGRTTTSTPKYSHQGATPRS